MATIDTNMSLVMIDPNEPLELYDGTIIKGRLEWFLYALCCLDYGNLPTPLSRIEEWANALITNELPNMEPQSRAEEFFKAILTGDTSNLPTPQSRSEVLLDKLARGENDFTNVEKIQSRYEFLLAYLIKNGGGIGNIDYVLYKFQKEDETLYNTKERPVKSAILKGKTLVNCIIDASRKGYGNFSNNVSIGNDRWITATASASNNHFELKMDSLNIKPSTKYLFVFECESNSFQGNGTNNLMLGDTYPGVVDSPWSGQLAISYLPIGVSKFTLTTKSDFSSLNNPIGCRSYISVGTGVTKFRYMIIEYQDGMENWSIPYFEGMQSVKMPVLTTTGKNLVNQLLPLNSNGGSLTTTTITNHTKVLSSLIKIPPNQQVVISKSNYGNRFRCFFYDSYPVVGKTMSIGGVYADTATHIKVTSPSNAQYLFVVWCNDKNVDYPINCQVEYGKDVTSYEPHKSNILTTARKNLFNMNRPYDNLTDSQATVVQDTNQITVSSAESGIYVNANFILDKDFFAGKTVTGSCLYESDEKDIGTVQIVYQDGNGEHHYQWIRTPRTFTFPNSFIGDVMLSVSANNTDTPQSNTVTVKNIQLELGSTATSYEPYSEEVTLRGIGEVKDTLDCLTGEVMERIGEIVLDGSQTGWSIHNKSDETYTVFYGVDIKEFDDAKQINFATVWKSDKFSNLGKWSIVQDYAQEYLTFHVTKPLIKLRNTSLSEISVNGLNTYLSQNPVTVQYILETPVIKTVDLSIVDQGGATIPKLNTFDKITHVNVSATDILPGEVEMEVATTVGEDLSGTLYSTMEDIETKQEALKESNNAQTESVNSTMMATTEIYESLL